MHQLIKDCIKELQKNDVAVRRFNEVAFGVFFDLRTGFNTGEVWSEDEMTPYESYSILSASAKLATVMAFLSRTPDGDAVMPFLSREVVEWYTFDKVLYRDLTSVLRVGFTFEKALDFTNYSYLKYKNYV